MHLAPSLARRLDRLARRAHAFHRFAHHPLCDRYAGELIRVGRRRRLCRGCSAAWTGAASGALLGLGLAPALHWAGLAALLGGAVLAGLRARPERMRSPDGTGRVSKLWTRALPSFGLCFGLVVCLVARDPRALGLAVAIGVVIVLVYLVYRARVPDRTPCTRCPERSSDVPCSGFRDIVRAERAFMRRSQQLLERDEAR
jgi:hypothetical protein